MPVRLAALDLFQQARPARETGEDQFLRRLHGGKVGVGSCFFEAPVACRRALKHKHAASWDLVLEISSIACLDS